jgi:CheY-like chemotaxis protein
MSTNSRKRVLIVEDEPLIAMTLQDIMEEIGLEIVGIASTVSDALQIIKSERPDAAILDVSLKDGTAYAAAEVLLAAGIPFAFCTGHQASAIELRFQIVPTLTKPFDEAAVQSMVRRLLAEIETKVG